MLGDKEADWEFEPAEEDASHRLESSRVLAAMRAAESRGSAIGLHGVELQAQMLVAGVREMLKPPAAAAPEPSSGPKPDAPAPALDNSPPGAEPGPEAQREEDHE